MSNNPKKKIGCEEIYAKELHQALLKKFQRSADIEIAIEGAPWYCTVLYDTHYCKVFCGELPGQMIPDYLVRFNRNTEKITEGRTDSVLDVVNSISRWLENATLDNLYDDFEYVDKNKRKFLDIEKLMIKSAPDLALTTKHGLHQWDQWSDIHYLRFDTEIRSVHFAFWGKNEIPDCFFDWDKSNLLKAQVENYQELGLAAKYWLCDEINPSKMAKEFSWFHVTKLAKFYEIGKGVEGDFVVSWDKTEKSFNRFAKNSKRFQQALHFISQLREYGYDHQLRAGSSLTRFIVSRSRRNGLRQDQASICFWFNDDSFEVSFDKVHSETKTSFSNYQVSDELRIMLDELVLTEIN